jgi:hypothetical protein
MVEQMLRSIPVAKATEDIRYVGVISGCYTLVNRRQKTTGHPQVFACRATSMSPREAVMIVPVRGELGERLSARFDHVGILKGQVSRLLPDGFAMTIEASDSERAGLAARIAWLKRRTMHAVADHREYKRSLPHDPRSVILFADNRTQGCFIIDYSQSGVAVSADALPQIGSPIAVGTLVGRVVRDFETGFAVQFATVQSNDGLEERLGIHPRARNAVLADLQAFAAASGKAE